MPPRAPSPLTAAKAECRDALARAKAADTRMAPICDTFWASTLLAIEDASAAAKLEMLRRSRIFFSIVEDHAGWPLRQG